MDHFLLHLLAKAAAPAVCGSRIGGVREVWPVVSIEFAGDEGSWYGVVILSAPGPFCYFDSVDPLGGSGEEVLRRIRGLPVTSVDVSPFDRVIRLGLSAPRDRMALIVSLFGARARIRVEGRETIIESLEATETGTPLRSGPSPHTASLTVMDASDLARFVGSADRLDRKVPGLTSELLDCFSFPDGGVDTTGLITFRDDLLAGRGSFILGTRGRAGAVSPLPVAADGAAPTSALPVMLGPFADVREACKTAGVSILLSLRMTIVDRHAAPLRKHLSSRRRLLSALEKERKDADSYTALRREANTLAAYQSRIPPGASEVTLPNPYGEGEISIKLDPSRPVREQIKRRFRRAAKLERGRAVIDRRILTVAEEIGRMEQDLAHARDRPLLADALRGIAAAMQRCGITRALPRTDKARLESRQLRRLDLDENWYVLVGRSDRENDEITFRIASPDDIWLHALHVPGSHVVLKSHRASGNPPNHILEAAAGVAAHFSKGRRASVVPVIFTRRKYVRKFKGSKHGQVVCEREKTIFAEPKLPESADESA